MNNKLLSLTCMLIICLSLLSACQTAHKPVDPSLRISANDFTALSQNDWSGKLRYLDYSSNKIAIISAKATFDTQTPNIIKYKTSYPAEPYMNTNETLRISHQGSKIDGQTITAVKRMQDRLVVVTEYEDSDNNLPASLRITYTLSSKAFKIKKEVKYADSQVFFMRNELNLSAE